MKQPFGFLEDVDAKSAWAHEAREFTPWLAANLSRIGSAVGLNLSLISSEAGLPTEDDRFSADIHALNDDDGSTVLIENQLAGSDHKHLGQILTYLPGLKAKTVIWLAPNFREAHRAAIAWLNENTTNEYAFFAVKLRVVRIGDSLLAPLFDILEQPNNWQRAISRKARVAEATADITIARIHFWETFNRLFPEHASDAGSRSSNRYSRFGDQVDLGYYVAKGQVGIYLRSVRGETQELAVDILTPYSARLMQELGAEFNPQGNWLFLQRMDGDFTDPDDLERLATWLGEKVRIYKSALNKIFPGTAEVTKT